MSFEDTSYRDEAAKTREALEKRLAELAARVDTITSTMAERGVDMFDDLREDAEDAAGNAVAVTRRAVHHMQEEASHVAETARENPIAAATVLTTVAAFGLAIGYLIGSATADRRYW